MLVLDICEGTGLDENEVINSLCNRLEDNFINQRNKEPIYLRNDGYRIQHTWALGFLWEILDKNIKWSHIVDMALDGFNRRVKVSIPFDKFYLRLQDIYLLFPKQILDLEDIGLSDKWKYGADYDDSRIDDIQIAADVAYEENPKPRITGKRRDKLSLAILSAMKEMGGKDKASNSDIWNYLADDGVPEVVVDDTDDKLVWVDQQGKLHDIGKKAFDNRLSRIRNPR
jgi:hypothetical protein